MYVGCTIADCDAVIAPADNAADITVARDCAGDFAITDCAAACAACTGTVSADNATDTITISADIGINQRDIFNRAVQTKATKKSHVTIAVDSQVGNGVTSSVKRAAEYVGILVTV